MVLDYHWKGLSFEVVLGFGEHVLATVESALVGQGVHEILLQTGKALELVQASVIPIRTEQTVDCLHQLG